MRDQKVYQHSKYVQKSLRFQTVAVNIHSIAAIFPGFIRNFSQSQRPVKTKQKNSYMPATAFDVSNIVWLFKQTHNHMITS